MRYAGAVFVAPLMAFLWVTSHPFNHDVAWLIEASRRWVAGGTLYRDIVEINPPLVFLEYVALSGGLLTKSAFFAGVCLAAALSSLWVVRLQGPMVGVIVSLALVLCAHGDFGQREHLALIFLTPFLLASPTGRKEAAALGAWAFIGAGLKPQLCLIPALYIAGQCLVARSIRPAFAIQNLVLGVLSLTYLLAAYLVWPQYFTEIIPLANKVYSAFGRNVFVPETAIAVLAIAFAALVAMRNRQLLPLGFAVIGAVASFAVQGRFWSYHLVPAVGLSAILLALAAIKDPGRMRGGLVAASAVFLLWAPFGVRNVYPGGFIPGKAKTVLFLSDRVPAAYPLVVECNMFNASRYPTFWTLPGAWNSGQRRIFLGEVAKMNEDIELYRPEVIFDDRYLGKFKPGFRFADWADLSDYRKVGAKGRFDILLRSDLPMEFLNGKAC